jgi:hypothetical protein
MRCRVSWPVLVAAVGFAAVVSAADLEPPRDVDRWHEVFNAAIGADYLDEETRGWELGIYPSLAVALGPPEWVAVQANGYLSVTKLGSFSLFAGYGYERGPGSESHLGTIGWGGVRRLSGAREQRGFYGKFLRYRRMEDFEHGLHHGLSVGSEAGAGIFGFAVEIGAARSQDNHWALTVQIAGKIAFPVVVALSRVESTLPKD